MSGGHYDYIQYRMEELADKIRRDAKRHDLSLDIQDRFEAAALTVERAAKMVNRIDWLLSDDDGEDSFMRRWEQELPEA